MKFSLAISPCPNDTFIFDALINKKIDTEGLSFEVFMEDVETLNKWAMEGRHDVTKLSFPAFFSSVEKYILLNSGSALGNGVGPLVISASENANAPGPANRVALPGENTTANLLFSFAYPEATNRKYINFSEIENSVLNGETDYGVIIHENRFTYKEKGLHKVIDLGNYWEEKTNLPIPLGGIAIRRSLELETAIKVDRLIRNSLEYSFANYPLISDFIRSHAQEMNEDVMRKHIDLYVNDFSLDLGEGGRQAIVHLKNVHQKLFPQSKSEQSELFIPSA